jgi:hypothetical protein
VELPLYTITSLIRDRAERKNVHAIVIRRDG